MSFNIGDVVILKSGGPKMTVGKTDSELTHCHWFEGKDRHMHPFPTGTLELGSVADERQARAFQNIGRNLGVA